MEEVEETAAESSQSLPQPSPASAPVEEKEEEDEAVVEDRSSDVSPNAYTPTWTGGNVREGEREWKVYNIRNAVSEAHTYTDTKKRPYTAMTLQTEQQQVADSVIIGRLCVCVCDDHYHHHKHTHTVSVSYAVVTHIYYIHIYKRSSNFISRRGRRHHQPSPHGLLPKVD